MELTLGRLYPSPDATVGVLYVDGVVECFTMERPAVQIPPGRYPVTLYNSPHFGRLVPLIGVPGRTYIEMHYGNYPQESDGCVLVGETRISETEIGLSRAAFDALFPKIEAALQGGEVWLTVADSTPLDPT